MTEIIAICSIYDYRPRLCRDYPEVDHWTPPECTYSFYNGERIGKCGCGVGACCATPREAGMPGGAHLPAEAGGLPCKYLVTEAKEKTATIDLNRTQAIQKAVEG